MHSDHIISLKKPQPNQEPPRIPEAPESKGNRGRHLYLYIVLCLAIVALAVGGVSYMRWLHLPAAAKVDSSKETGDLVAEVGKLILLPTGETPTIADVTDPEKLKGEIFFKNAMIGDKVLIYVEAEKAYLYRPSSHLLIDVSPITSATK